jgi:hypothetical protein
MTDTGLEPRADAGTGTAGGVTGGGVGGDADEVWAIAERARSCDGVAGLFGCLFGAVATYLPAGGSWVSP